MNDSILQEIVSDLYSTRRDLISEGFDEALTYISQLIPLSVVEIPTGTECWTWIVPPKWTISNGWIHSGSRVYLDYSDHPLHVMSYSDSIRKRVSREELLSHLYTYPERPDAIPYEFNYYEKKWGFCLQHSKLSEFENGTYDVRIDSQFSKGTLKIGELVIPGKLKEEIVMISHLCHPNMANDNLSGVAVLIGVAKELERQLYNKYTFRILFLPEFIGSIAYLSQNEHLIPHMKYAIVVDCVGHNDIISLQHSRQATTELDICASNVLKNETLMYREGGMNEICGSDERVFNGPGVNIPTINISRLKFWSKGEWPYPEYHSSDDTPDIIVPENLVETKKIIMQILEILNSNYVPKRNFMGPVCLSRYGLWVDWKKNRKLNLAFSDVMWLLEGNKSILEISEEMEIPFSDLYAWLDHLHKHGLVQKK